jgi:copper chaperone NosL
LIKTLSGFFIILVFILAGCVKYVPDKPPVIMAGKDACDNCFMIINENKYAASIWLQNGEAKRFDDIGCMMNYVHKNNSNVTAYWVYDYNSGQPVKAENSFFISTDSVTTPMGSGLIAFKSMNEASSSASKFNTKIISFNELKSKFQK